MKTIYYLAISLVIFGCKPKIDKQEYDKGEINPSNYVAIGGTLTAGYMDDALTFNGQLNSLGAIISTQFEAIDGGMYSQPFMSSSSVGYSQNGLSKLILGYKTDCLNVTSLSPVRYQSSGGDATGFNASVFVSGQFFNNYGIPFMKMSEFSQPWMGNPANGAGLYNPFFTRISSNPANASVKNEILAKAPTFFTINIGMDEVLLHAKQGAKMNLLDPSNGPDQVGFDGSLIALVDALVTQGAKGAISTIPDVSDFPYFTTIPYDGLTLDAANAQTLNDVYNPIGIYFQVGKNAFVIEDPSAGAFGVRKMVAGEKITLAAPLDSVKCYKMGSLFPFRNEFVLTLGELDAMRTRISEYNNIITSTATTYNLALVDAYSFFKELKTGVSFNGINLNATFVSGGAFSLDGITLNPRGNALLANKYINAINIKYKSKIPFADATKYPSVIFP